MTIRGGIVIFSQLRRTAAVGLVLGAAACAATPAVAAKGPGVTCRYVESGPAGPSGNELRVKVLADERGASVGRAGSAIWVRASRLEEESSDGVFGTGAGSATIASVRRDSIAVASAGRPSKAIACSGGAPTVTNLDAIKVVLSRAAYEAPIVINLRHGPLGPGATDEGDGSSEIEASVQISSFASLDEYETPTLGIRGSDGDDSHSIAPELTGFAINLNATEATPDTDLSASPISTYFLTGAGDDTLSAKGAPLEAFVPVAGYGGRGSDTVTTSGGLVFSLGGRGADTFVGGQGLNLALGGPGNDTLTGSNGRDLFLGGAGSDEMRSGKGGDLLYAADGEQDVVICGRGRRDAARVDRRDHPRGCERTDREGPGR